jgi:hypothetical protein
MAILTGQFGVVIDRREFDRFLRQAPSEFRTALSACVRKAAEDIADRMEAFAPVGPDAPHIKDEIKVRGARGKQLTARIGYFDQTPSSERGKATQPMVALFNEYAPNDQAFMRPAANAEADTFAKRATDAIRAAERNLKVSG